MLPPTSLPSRRWAFLLRWLFAVNLCTLPIDMFFYHRTVRAADPHLAPVSAARVRRMQHLAAASRAAAATATAATAAAATAAAAAARIAASTNATATNATGGLRVRRSTGRCGTRWTT